MIVPISHGISPEGGFKFMRAFLGIVASLGIGTIITFFTKPKSDEELKGLVIDSFDEAKRFYKGGTPNEEKPGETIRVKFKLKEIDGVSLSQYALEHLAANVGDMIYLSDARWYFGGLRSVHTKVTSVHNEQDTLIYLSEDMKKEGHFLKEKDLTVEKII